MAGQPAGASEPTQEGEADDGAKVPLPLRMERSSRPARSGPRTQAQEVMLSTPHCRHIVVCIQTSESY